MLFASALMLSSCSKNETPHGYKFVKHIKGSGPKANVNDYAYVHIYIYFDDSLAQSTRDAGRTMPVKVPDLSKISEDDKNKKDAPPADPLPDVAGMMNVGDSLTLTVPITDKLKAMPQLAGVSKLTYDIVLVEVKTEAQYQESLAADKKARDEKAAALIAKEPEVAKLVSDVAAQYASNKLADKLKTTESGLKYMVIEAGSGAPLEVGKPVQANYYGTLTNGKMFDNSFSKGRPLNFQLGAGQVIPGWDEGFALLKEGDKAVLFVPAALGYGAAGKGPNLPPNSELIFYIEVEKYGK